jgi:pimeloyl-ACP methyl ester carboxylesterase
MTDTRPDPLLGLAGPTSHTYFSQRLRLHYLDWGNADAPPLLLVHGNRDHAHNWDWVAARFRHEYHVVAVDLRGHGDSQWAAGSSYGMAEYVYDLTQLIHQQRLAPLRIVAHSLGGYVTLRYSGIFPEDVLRLVVVEGTGGPVQPVDERPAPYERYRHWIEANRSVAGRVPRRYPSLDDAYARMQEANPHLSPDQVRHLTVHGANQNEDGTYSWKFDNAVHGLGMLDLSPEETRRIWSNIACPVLLVYGGESFHLAWTEPEEQASHFRAGRAEVIPGAGHWVQHDQLDGFVELVRGFLAD